VGLQIERTKAQERAGREANQIRIAAEKVAREWLPLIAKRQNKKVPLWQRPSLLEKLAKHPKVLEEARRRVDSAKQ
jgi:hypothetical protein